MFFSSSFCLCVVLVHVHILHTLAAKCLLLMHKEFSEWVFGSNQYEIDVSRSSHSLCTPPQQILIEEREVKKNNDIFLLYSSRHCLESIIFFKIYFSHVMWSNWMLFQLSISFHRFASFFIRFFDRVYAVCAHYAHTIFIREIHMIWMTRARARIGKMYIRWWWCCDRLRMKEEKKTWLNRFK